ncbi:hypothetical protein SteCoe_16981 [Stentor coeruleus]|uniref:Uncharacterized protein n=1 Tax=Stentor coeruleus TaxID=5963 RepID=A0A1R2BZT8_9CILI|nr:hypothetical protein SteCoe_16981 [Stentor coeruleus]
METERSGVDKNFRTMNSLRDKDHKKGFLGRMREKINSKTIKGAISVELPRRDDYQKDVAFHYKTQSQVVLSVKKVDLFPTNHVEPFFYVRPLHGDD